MKTVASDFSLPKCSRAFLLLTSFPLFRLSFHLVLRNFFSSRRPHLSIFLCQPCFIFQSPHSIALALLSSSSARFAVSCNAFVRDLFSRCATVCNCFSITSFFPRSFEEGSRNRNFPFFSFFSDDFNGSLPYTVGSKKSQDLLLFSKLPSLKDSSFCNLFHRLSSKTPSTT